MTREAKLAEAATDLYDPDTKKSQGTAASIANALRPAHPVRMMLNRAECEFRNMQHLDAYMSKAAAAIGPMPAEAQAALADVFWKAKGPR